MYGQSIGAISRDCFEDGIGCLGPDEWLGLVIVGLDEGGDSGLEPIDAAMHAALTRCRAAADRKLIRRLPSIY